MAISRRIGFINIISGLVATAALTLPLATSGAQAAEPKKGGSVSITLESDLPSLDPLSFASYNDRNAGLLMYDTLLDIDEKGNIIPNIAKIDAAKDATSFKLTLRDGVKFTDGTPYDAAAVVKNFERIRDPKNRCRCISDLSTIDTIEATGPLEVTIKMKSPSAHFPATLADVPGMIVSPTAAAKYGADFGTHGIGAGPFKLKEWQRGAQVVFERNADYWRKPQPYLDEVVLRPMPDEQTRYASLKAGNLDIVTNAAARDRVDAAQGKKFQISNPGSLATSFIQINMKSPDVSDPRVRLALALALDRPTLNKALNRGLYKIANTPFGTGLFPHEAVDGYPGYDPAKAKKLIEEYGKPVKVKLSINASPQNAINGQAIQQMWKKIGVETEIVPLEQVQLVRAAAARDYQVMLYRWAGGADPDKNVHQFFHSKGTMNRPNYSNPEMDKLLDAGRATTDKAERLKIYRQVNNLLAKDLPYLFLWYFDNVALVNPQVKGLKPIPDGLLRMQTVWKDK